MLKVKIQFGKPAPHIAAEKFAAGTKKPASTVAGSGSGSKVDSAYFSVGSFTGVSLGDDKQLMTLRSKLQYDVSANADTERLETIKAGIKDGSYNIESSDIISEMLGNFK